MGSEIFSIFNTSSTWSSNLKCIRSDMSGLRSVLTRSHESSVIFLLLSHEEKRLNPSIAHRPHALIRNSDFDVWNVIFTTLAERSLFEAVSEAGVDWDMMICQRWSYCDVLRMSPCGRRSSCWRVQAVTGTLLSAEEHYGTWKWNQSECLCTVTWDPLLPTTEAGLACGFKSEMWGGGGTTSCS